MQSCVDASAMSAQFKMVRLEACLEGEALETIKGLGYSEAAYEAAKSRILRKYSGNRQEIQRRVNQNETNQRRKCFKELEKFADMLEQAVINLQENNRAGTLYTIILEKLPERLLSQYIRWVKENRRVESLITLKDWTAEEAEYQIQATEIKHCLRRLERVFRCTRAQSTHAIIKMHASAESVTKSVHRKLMLRKIARTGNKSCGKHLYLARKFAR